ncbi:MAG: protein kinase [Deltaproteobacteria bacterium]|nr:protein kinase [Deltaproteobacteria bacterium]
MTEPHRSRVPPTIPGYRLVRPLGPPGIYEAEHGESRSAVAVQVVDRDVSTGDGFLARFQREADALKSVRHPHVAELRSLQAPTAEATAFVVLEPLLGETLDDRLTHGPALREAAAVRIAIQMLEGLSAAHRGGAVHHDLRPENVFLVPGPDGKPRVKLVGFGLGRPVATADLTDQVPESAGTVLQPGYAPPEAFSERPADVTGNVFSAGMILYHLLAGRLPFKASNPEALWVERLCDREGSGEYRSSRDWIATIPPMLSEAVSLAIRRRPAERYPSAEAFRRRLLEFEASTGEGRASRPSVRPPAGTDRASSAGRAVSSAPSSAAADRTSSKPPAAPARTSSRPPAAPLPSSGPPDPTLRRSETPPATLRPSSEPPGPAERRSSAPPRRPSSRPPTRPSLRPLDRLVASEPPGERESMPAAPRPSLSPRPRGQWIDLALGVAATAAAVFLLLRARPSGVSSGTAGPPAGTTDGDFVAVGPSARAGAGTAGSAADAGFVEAPGDAGPGAPPLEASGGAAVWEDPLSPFAVSALPPVAAWPDGRGGPDGLAEPYEPASPPGVTLPAPAPGMVRLRFAVRPPNAVVHVDGRPVGVYNTIDLPRADRTLTVTVEPPDDRFLRYEGYFVALRSRTIAIRLEQRE